MKLFMYVRKSSESEERQELSMPAQKTELVAFAQRKQLTVIGEPFEEAMSAKEPGRPVFNAVITKIMAGEADGLLCWKLDRLARNPVDGGSLMYALGKGRIKTITTPERTYSGTADDKLLMSIIFGMATKYSDDLSDNVRRGNREALRNGRWPGRPKLGYLRDHESKALIPDPARFSIVVRLWRALLDGRRPLDLLALARELRLTTPARGRTGGAVVGKSALYRLFHDPFYAGLMMVRGEAFPGTHPPMITMAEFDQAQAVLDGRTRPMTKPKERFFAYRGLLRCGRCGAAVTAKITINRYGKTYTHYYCCRKERRYQYCPEGAVQERTIGNTLAAFAETALPPEPWIKATLELLHTEDKLRSLDQARVEKERERQRADLERQRERLRDLLVRCVITEEDYTKSNTALLENEQRLGAAGTAPPSVADVEPVEEAVRWLRLANKRLTDGTPQEKRELAEAMTWNLTLESKSLRILAKEPFALLAAWRGFPTLSAWRSHVRTFARRRDRVPLSGSTRTESSAQAHSPKPPHL